MFKVRCLRCGRKVKKDFDYCPYCAANLKIKKDMKDYGLLGKNDMADMGFNIKMPFGLNRLFNSLLKEVDKQFKEFDKDLAEDKKKFYMDKKIKPTSGISISISTNTGEKPKIKIMGFGPEFKNIECKELKEQEGKLKKVEFSEEKAKKLVGLPRKEASTKVRRLSNKIIYEIDLPGVKSIRDVIINKLENSIEIKAIAKDNAYFKLLPLNLPLLNYKLKEGKLILEFEPKG